MNSKRAYYLMSGILGLLIFAILGSAYLASNMLTAKAATLQAAKLKTRVLEEEQRRLVKAKQDIEKYKSLEEIAKAIVPQDKDQAQTVREIVAIAAQSGITPSTINFPSSDLGAAGAATPATGLSQVKPVTGNPGLYVLPIAVTLEASTPVLYSQFIDFLSRLEQNRRTSQVSSIALQPSSTDRNKLSFTLTLDKYIKP